MGDGANMASHSTKPDWRPHVAFGFLLSGFMSLIVSGIATARILGATVLADPSSALGSWMGTWLSSWLVAFPVVLVVAPVVRRLVAAMFAQR